MSLVTTARSYSLPSVRHSAAARAVLPEPTGPPRPTRSGPLRRSAAGASAEECRSWSGDKEKVPSGGVHLGEEAEQGIGRRGEVRAEMAILAPDGGGDRV